jgi:hypothetical protein
VAKSFSKSFDLTSTVYDAARKQVLGRIGKAIERLDALYAKDAAKLKAELARLFKVSGIPQRRAAQVIDKVLQGSRAERIEVVTKAIEDAARHGRKLDKATFDAVFGKDPDIPKAKGRSGLRLIGKPSRLPASGSEDESSSSG